MTDTITLTGNIATEPEERRTPNGTPLVSFRLATSQRRFDRTTEKWVDNGTNWFTVSTWRGLAEHAARSLHKGDRVIVVGRLRVRDWESNGKRGTSVDIDADSVGHDLLWGTSTFSRAAGAGAAASGGADDRRDADAEPPVDGDGWAVPGAGASGSPSGREGEDDRASGRERELVDSGAATPF